jgi:predicted site-specific integrase-resolvase
MTTTLNQDPTPKALAEQIGVAPATILRYIRNGRIIAYRLPGPRSRWHIPTDEFQRVLSLKPPQAGDIVEKPV